MSFLGAMLLLASKQAAGHLAKKSVRWRFGIHMRHGRRKKNFGLAFDDVKRRGSVLAFAANDLALAIMPAHHRVLVQLQKRSRDLLEIGELLQLFDVHRFARQHRFHHALVGERAGGARHHALAARHAGRVAHRQVGVERDARHEAFAAPAQNVVVANLVAAANAAVAQDARFVIHRDDERRIVLAARRDPAGKARLRDAFQAGQRFQLAIVRLPLPRARAGMIGHQHFHQRPARARHLFGVGGNHHVVFGRPHAGSRQNAAADIHHAYAAHAHRRFVLLMAQRGNRDAVGARGIEHRGAFGDRNLQAVDGEIDVPHATSESCDTPRASGRRLPDTDGRERALQSLRENAAAPSSAANARIAPARRWR